VLRRRLAGSYSAALLAGAGPQIGLTVSGAHTSSAKKYPIYGVAIVRLA